MLDTQNFIVRQLLAERVVSEIHVKQATEHAKRSGVDLLEALTKIGAVSSKRLAISKARICEYPFVDLQHFEIDFGNAALLPAPIAERLGAFPLFVLDGTATVAMQDPMNLQAIDQIRQLVKCDVDPVLCDSEQLRSLMQRAYSIVRAGETEASALPADDRDLARADDPIVSVVNQIISGAIEGGASDIHINPEERDLVLRYRVDGALVRKQSPTKGAHAAIAQRLKVLAKLDVTQTRKPQDGKFSFEHRSERVDVRLSLLPTLYGENVVMRLLRGTTRVSTIAELGMTPQMSAWFQDIIRRPHGMVLVTGPTGSGKTTTLYTALQTINHADVNIMTIEDPVEIRLPMVRQTQCNSEIGLTFASVLRSILRQDPDVVLVGEIRDEETARIATQAALTGHLVLSTLHTNDAVGALTRLRDMGVPGFAVNNSLLAILAQRLVRRLCPKCRVPEDAATLSRLFPGVDAKGAMRAPGCAECGQSGVKGRVGVYEMLRVTPRLQELLNAGAAEPAVRVAAREEGMRSLWEHGITRLQKGECAADDIDALRALVELGDAAPQGGRAAA